MTAQYRPLAPLERPNFYVGAWSLQHCNECSFRNGSRDIWLPDMDLRLKSARTFPHPKTDGETRAAVEAAMRSTTAWPPAGYVLPTNIHQW